MTRLMPITKSPYADVPLIRLTPQGQYDRYYTRTEEFFVPWSVDRVLRKVYHRDYSDDLTAFLTTGHDTFTLWNDEVWNVSSVSVFRCRLVSTESVLGQSMCGFSVDQVVEARVRWNLVDPAFSRRTRTEFTSGVFRLRYRFDFRPHRLTCEFAGVLEGEGKSLCACYPDAVRLNEFLLPIMNSDDFRRFADRVRLSLLGVRPEDDSPLDPRRMLQALDLRLLDGAFEDEALLGLYFHDYGSARVLDPETAFPGRCPVDPGSVVVSAMIADPAVWNSTVVHECAHFLLHTPFFILQKAHGHTYCAYMKKSSVSKRGETDPLSIMENTAEVLTGYLMVPSVPGRIRAAGLLRSYTEGGREEKLRRLVGDIAAHYGVTKEIALRRLVDLGYTELTDLVRRSRFRCRISDRESLAEFVRNPAFRECLRTGDYVRADDAWCLDRPHFVSRDRDGTPHLTYWAHAHLSECCLQFRIAEGRSEQEPGNAARKILGHTHSVAEFAGPDGRLPVTEEGLAFRRQLEAVYEDEDALTESFNSMVSRLMRERGVSMDKLCELTGLSLGTVKNLRKDPGRFFPVEEIVAFCIALQLPPRVSQLVVAQSPAKFINTTDMRLYEYAMLNYYRKPVSWVNRWLLSAGAPPLTSLIDGYDEDGHFLVS